jgi:hypothetical protein
VEGERKNGKEEAEPEGTTATQERRIKLRTEGREGIKIQ